MGKLSGLLCQGLPMSFIYGFTLGLSLILAIGAQNAFVLRQGLADRHVGLVCLACALSDVLLIGMGVAGIGGWLAGHTLLTEYVRYAGALFLAFYAVQHARAACRGAGALSPADLTRSSLGRTLAACLALTWLNPHVYIDTLLLLGSASATFGDTRWWFAAGAICASFVFFFTLGYGARQLRGLFARPGVWQVLDGTIAALMAVLAWRLATGG